MSISSAIEAVFSTYELLEHIFIKLTIRQLFRNQRVSTTWRAVILRSQSLRRRMWLASSRAPLDPVVKDIKPWAPEYDRPFRTNPYVNVVYSRRQRHCKHGHRGAHKTYAMYKFATLGLKRRKFRLYNQQRPSYHDMLITKPPVSTVDIFHEKVQSKIGSTRQIGTIRRARGVRMGDVCAAVDALRRSHETATGDDILEWPHSAMGFVWVDNGMPNYLRDPLKPKLGERYGDCEVCEETSKDDGAGNASERAA